MTSDQEAVEAVERLRAALAGATLPLDLPSAAARRTERQELLDQLEDYVLPRLRQIEAPLLAVVGGSTGAGKSTLVNSLLGSRVTEPGVLRPTTRSPVLAFNPADARWFDAGRILPDLARTSAPTQDPAALQLVPVESLHEGLAVLDAPDIDSVESRNRTLASQLLAAADLWLFVTSAARYADQVPWDFLRAAAERSTAVAVVLDRVPPGAEDEVTQHLRQMLAERGLARSPLFTVTESPVDGSGLLPAAAVAPVREWLHGLAADSAARAAVVRQTLEGAIRSAASRSGALAAAHAEQVDTVERLRSDARQAYRAAVTQVEEASADGTLLRGEVLARWQEFVGTGELLRSLETRVGWLRDRVGGWVRGKPVQAERVTVAVESGLESLLVEHAESAAEQASWAWGSSEAGRALLPPELSRASRGFRAAAERAVRDWQQGVLDLVRSEGADKRSTARFLAFGVNGLSVALMVVVFAHTAGITGAEAGIAGGSAVLGQKLLEAVFGDQAVRRLAEHARRDLAARVTELYAAEAARFDEVLDGLGLAGADTEALWEASRSVGRATP
ncbi:ABC transporter [Nocardioides marmoribigeumensis]|uniref:Energy-coupling factor transporter ATP-binding protein EcfA2 n=1 Tax=Nocardioides marmoribigeumensis TaxID=433649 RepID=A0ABU2C0I1_9ACTN|nr:ABC transporter [Nocardioides marmoribigeumensis]MDR7364192.1 energy-coupling factor transporter ATP-binding protein EcfA2 [Nocardioides marmoribigeumensis]